MEHNPEMEKELEIKRKEVIGRVYSRYKICEQIGSGGFATVYDVEYTDAQGRPRPRVAKIYFMDVIEKYLERVQYKQILLSTNREAKDLEKLSHPNIVKAYKYMGRENAESGKLMKVILIMSKVNGPTLKNHVENIGPLKEEGVIECLQQLISALQKMKEENIIHRDIKPDNIMLEGTKPILIDFGCSKITTQAQTQIPSCIMGSNGYTAPEIYANHPASEKSEVFGLGCTAFYMISGVHPHEIPKVTRNVCKSIGECLSRMPLYSEVIKTFIKSATITDYNQRASLDELSKLLEEPIMPVSTNQNIEYFMDTSIAVQVSHKTLCPVDDDPFI
jgi:serine/threonine-protein kinase